MRDVEGTIPLGSSGWCVLRASTDAAHDEVLDNYVYATTSPIYVTIGGAAPRSPEDAKYFAAWMDRLSEAAASYPDWNNAGGEARRARANRASQGRVRGHGIAKRAPLLRRPHRLPRASTSGRQHALRFRGVRGDQVHQRRR